MGGFLRFWGWGVGGGGFLRGMVCGYRLRMKALAVLAAVLVVVPAAAADFEAGLTAARAGDFKGAYAEWKPLADAGHARAALNLGQMYEAGEGVALDLGEAARLFRVAADGGLGQGQLAWGMALQTGQGVARDKAEAFRWLMKAAEQHVPEATYQVGYAYHEGEGVEPDMVEAMKWFIIADEYGWREAYPAGTYTADRLDPDQLILASQNAMAWMAKHPRPEMR